MSCEQKSCLVQKQVQLAFHQFQLIVQIRAWKLKQGKENDVLTQVQELFCLRELVKSSNPRSDPETAKKPFFLKSHLKRWILSLWRVCQLDYTRVSSCIKFLRLTQSSVSSVSRLTLSSVSTLQTWYKTHWVPHWVPPVWYSAPAPSRWWVVALALALTHYVKLFWLPVAISC